MADEKTPIAPSAPTSAQPSQAPQSKLFEGAIQNWKFVLKFLIFSIVVFAIQLAFQLYFLGISDFNIAFLRAAGLSGATFITSALVLSSYFKWKPKYARFWYVRRSFGVVGWLFISLHIFFVINNYYQGSYFAPFTVLDPFQNPVVFGLLAYPVFMLMALTSTDWAVDKLGYNTWKMIHRLVYFGYAFAVFHFMTVNPSLLKNPSGYFLLLLAFLALAGELYWYLKGVQQKRIKMLGTLIGAIVILMYLAFAYVVFLS